MEFFLFGIYVCKKHMDIYNTSTVNKFLHVYIVSLPISLWHQIFELILYCILESMYICIHSENNLSFYVLSEKKVLSQLPIGLPL